MPRKSRNRDTLITPLTLSNHLYGWRKLHVCSVTINVQISFYAVITIRTAQTIIFPGDRILLCSDGIHDNLTDAEIETIVRSRAHTTVARRLVQCAFERSREECLRAKKDDMSAVVITCNL